MFFRWSFLWIFLVQKQSSRGVLKKRCSWKFRKIHRKTPLSESIFLTKLQASGFRPSTLSKKRLWHRCFPVKSMKFLRTPFLQNTSGACFYWLRIKYSLKKSEKVLVEKLLQDLLTIILCFKIIKLRTDLINRCLSFNIYEPFDFKRTRCKKSLHLKNSLKKRLDL